MMVINNIMYLIIYLYVNITLLISYICGIVLVELKLLQVLCNRSVNHLKKKMNTYSGGQKEKKNETIAVVKKRC